MKTPFIQRIVERVDDLHKVEFVFNDAYLNEVVVLSRPTARHRKWITEMHWLWMHLVVNNEMPPASPSQATIDTCVTALRIGVRVREEGKCVQESTVSLQQQLHEHGCFVSLAGTMAECPSNGPPLKKS